ncbi:MAG: hypothetical protein JOZ19_03300 [Rubrobacter sp.]|nr:hypothetical protein [Rubrobacter sp.]
MTIEPSHLRHAEGILKDLEDEGYIEITSGQKGELIQFTEEAIDEVFG